MPDNNLQKEVNQIIAQALEEDFAFDDITSDATILDNNNLKFALNSRQEMVFCGQNIITQVFEQLKSHKKFQNSSLTIEILAKDGGYLTKGQAIAKGYGEAKLIFAGERVILNLIQHLSAIATSTATYVQKLANDKIAILDTRKTIPGLRYLQKYAVLIGGGKNHRFNLSDQILIKDNHIAAAGNIAKAIKMAKEKGQNQVKIEVECDNIEQVKEAARENPDIIMLDNMNDEKIANCSKIIRDFNPNIKIEISGGINLENISNFKNLDIDYISVGALTHHVRAVDIGLDII